MMRRWHKPSLNKSPAPAFEPNSVDRARHLNRVLERERVRADRTGRTLSLVLMGYDGGPSGRRSAELSIVETLRQRCRITDDVGWFDKRTGFAVLPDTGSPGAARFARSVHDYLLKHRGVATSFAIYQYGTETDRDDRDPPRGQRRDDHAAHHPAAWSGAEPPEPLERIGEVAESTSPPRVASATAESVFARRLPWWKRATDIAVAGTGLVLASPLMIAAAVAIKLDSRGPVIFKQQRAGLGNVPFGIWKFRTMSADAERRRDEVLGTNELDGPAFKMKSDPRVTRVGKLLRKTSVDELPQLVNILRGNMTLVGPRPLPLVESDACSPWQRRRLEVTPGLTCIWQVWGRQGVTFDQWMRMDLRYSGRRTFQHDMKILLHTVPAVLKQRGAC